MTARFEVENGGEKLIFGPYEPEGTAFAAELTMELTDSTVIYVVFESGDKRETQKLTSYDSLYTRTFTELNILDDLHPWTTAPENGVLRINQWYATVDASRSASVTAAEAHLRPREIVSFRIGLFRNRSLICWAEPTEKPANWVTNTEQLYYRFPDGELAVAEGDEVFVATHVTDEYGRTYLCADWPGYVCQDGVMEHANVVLGIVTDLSGWDLTPEI